MRSFYTLGFDGNHQDLPDQDLEAETAYGAIRQYKQEYPAATWISARPIPGSDEDRRIWESHQPVSNSDEWSANTSSDPHVDAISIGNSLHSFGLTPEMGYTLNWADGDEEVFYQHNQDSGIQWL